MLITLEGQPLCKGFRSGVGWYTYNIIKKVIELDKEDAFQINIFDFMGRNKSEKVILEMFSKTKNTSVSMCTLMPAGLYIRNQNFFRFISYSNLFGRADISHFFNFVIPKNIKGKVINTVHDMVYKRYPETMNQVNYKLLCNNLERSCRNADVIVTVSQNSKKEIAEFMNVPHEKIEVTYNAVNKEIFYPRRDYNLVREKYKIEGDYIFYLGTLEPRKNVSSLLKAFSILSYRNKDIKLVITGGRGWKYDEIFKLVDELNLNDKVIFTGYAAEEDIPALYSCALIFVFPSLYEGFGMPPLEAMACGTPVIVSNTSSLPEVVGDAGILADPMDIENIAYEMDRLINDDNLKSHYSREGLIRSEYFSWEDSARKILNIYKALS